MDFNIELTVLPSAVHKCIYSSARGITPLERSLSFVADSEMRSSCTAFHRFLIDMLSDMYDHPEAYDLPVGELEKFCDGKKINGMKQKYPSKTKTVLSHTRNSVHVYMMLLCMLARGEASERIEKFVNAGRSPISLEKRLEAIERVGYTARFSEMSKAMQALAKKCDKFSGFDFFAFCNAEFRNIDKKYKPTYEDYFNPLISAQRKHAESLHKFAINNKLTPAISTFWKAEYK